ncbi:LLM class flavin-dependent oxidoreductase [Paraburkholderia caballeronis]|uniref:FMN-dependent oxidoreductase, nitrilotriacetate monooxygenase family n=1 Tax=Paraburkholderia caballeronis TaxID=416943 RepID=A0A1H7FBF9_9BURK|nr:LLM class flavin-dependent oxidoreductase [Paraburkholderia caballeronis]PXW24061.1 FMN-dependent oxidoreductase (nitrilotriacetate monooxygenase family) [Paraburkholderia caballeronis]PXW99825.1 FMN-dependent oxidoreductase (nitrilotriacetate monooxygenase family) [Paraburkholderia caballeronis]RAJ96779.1 FMN-dependent oxidoreductase (nitrilotriacetate monooxygenase family) [Paraburkholderia caballeronis]SEE74653.1 FMN-dependent oxidoreductase, nitrilotriacetate monooxygenase family [Parabu
MSRPIRFNAFEMNCVGHQSPGLWAHPRDRSWQYKDLDYWTDLAKLLEKGIFDGIFIADVIGYYDVYKGSNYHALHQAAQIPVNDPLQVAAPIAMVTEHLGIGITASTSFEHPYTFARRLSTADHHTKGRVGWNIVTSYLESGAKNIGQGGLRDHSNRYEVAAEYVEVLYKLFEGSWEDGAVVRDRQQRVFTHPEKVHEIGHQGRFFDVPGYHLCEPSPQRTPVLYQAGASGPGKTFAAQHAECVFVAAPTQSVLKQYVADVRRQASEAGRDPARLLIYNLVTVIVDETDAKAHAKFEEYQRYVSYDGSLVFMSGWTGIDFGQYAPTDLVRRVETNAIVSAVEHLAGGDRSWTIEELATWGGIGGMGPVFVGSASTVADILQQWVEATGVDGFNLAYAIAHETFEDVVHYLVPELQRRGVYPTSYREGTLREKLFGAGARLPGDHPAARYRDIERVKREEAAQREEAVTAR